MKKNKKRNRFSEITIKVDPKIYPPEVIEGAAYTFVDRVYVGIAGNPSRRISVTLTGKENSSRGEILRLAGEFKNELLNYALRREINRNNKEIREYIVSRALFSAVTPAKDEFEIIKKKAKEAEKKDRAKKNKKGDFIDDPLGIAVPWEEKFGKQ